MKKLNKKGFTLVELLAVIVILAVIMVITIPTVLGSMSGAKASAFESAVATIEEYVEKQYEMCQAGLGTLAGPMNNSIISDQCVLTNDAKTLVVGAAGYSTDDIEIISLSLENGKATIEANAVDGGKFK